MPAPSVAEPPRTLPARGLEPWADFSQLLPPTLRPLASELLPRDPLSVARVWDPSTPAASALGPHRPAPAPEVVAEARSTPGCSRLRGAAPDAVEFAGTPGPSRQLAALCLTPASANEQGECACPAPPLTIRTNPIARKARRAKPRTRRGGVAGGGSGRSSKVRLLRGGPRRWKAQ